LIVPDNLGILAKTLRCDALIGAQSGLQADFLGFIARALRF
jgi:hypothetical protein